MKKLLISTFCVMALCSAAQAQTDAKSIAAKVDADFDRLDTNHDGKISREEFKNDKKFDAIDTNHDGMLSREEMLAQELKDAESMEKGSGR